jgi:hypothetical protein
MTAAEHLPLTARKATLARTTYQQRKDYRKLWCQRYHSDVMQLA